jgi:hypothetical protein
MASYTIPAMARAFQSSADHCRVADHRQRMWMNLFFLSTPHCTSPIILLACDQAVMLPVFWLLYLPLQLASLARSEPNEHDHQNDGHGPGIHPF